MRRNGRRGLTVKRMFWTVVTGVLLLLLPSLPFMMLSADAAKEGLLGAHESGIHIPESSDTLTLLVVVLGCSFVILLTFLMLWHDSNHFTDRDMK